MGEIGVPWRGDEDGQGHEPPDGDDDGRKAGVATLRVVVGIAVVIAVGVVGWGAVAGSDDHPTDRAGASGAASTTEPPPETTPTTSPNGLLVPGEFFTLDATAPKDTTTCVGIVGVCVGEAVEDSLSHLGLPDATFPPRDGGPAETMRRWDVTDAFSVSVVELAEEPGVVARVGVEWTDAPDLRFAFAQSKVLSGALRVGDLAALFGSPKDVKDVPGDGNFVRSQTFAIGPGGTMALVASAILDADALAGTEPRQEDWDAAPVRGLEVGAFPG
jgi:hypothetical protein